jgi:hypothetical protein
LAIDGTVLLKNDQNFLPSGIRNARSIAMVGDACNATSFSGGGRWVFVSFLCFRKSEHESTKHVVVKQYKCVFSGYVCCDPAVRPWVAMAARAGPNVTVTFVSTMDSAGWHIAAQVRFLVVFVIGNRSLCFSIHCFFHVVGRCRYCLRNELVDRGFLFGFVFPRSLDAR